MNLCGGCVTRKWQFRAVSLRALGLGYHGVDIPDAGGRVIATEVMSDLPMKVQESSQTSIDFHRNDVFDRLLAGLPLGHIAGNDRRRVESLAVRLLGPAAKVNQAAPVGSNRQLAFTLLGQVVQLFKDGGMECWRCHKSLPKNMLAIFWPLPG